MSALISLVGIAVLFTVAFLSSTNRRHINWRTVSLALLLQFTLGGIVLYLPIGVSLLSAISDAVTSVLGNAQDGIAFVFGPIGAFEMGFIFAFHVLPVIVFFSALVSVLYYLGIMGWIIRVIGGALQKLLGTSKAESMSATANIFVGQTEAPLVVKPYIPNMTRSELFAVMVGGMATVAGSVLAGYVLLGVELRYLLAASFMAAPGGFLMAKMMIPETEEIVEDSEEIELKFDEHVNVIDAAAAGASSGMALALNVGAMVLAFVGLIALINAILAWAGGLVGFESLSLQLLLGYAFQPLAFLLGIPWEETNLAGSLIGQKLVFNEFVAFVALTEQMESLSAHSQAVVTFALCGFANFSSIGIMLGGLGTMAPTRRSDVAELGVRAVFAGFLANLMSGAIASFFLSIN
ncbi:NupC/NupG family nucleoside CNT transporter [Gammaproteobacteria bacterium]|jgi:CNT family concentrative nucleoside transporter|nr:NupC/NupG family nucleoside CNT transporter [Gammaproteobacteria bacterium]MDA9301003.1 NupC/NupG family nucleoside CNT transporter [bacterium]MDA7782712.1 NupC/NupG family nucleoside CNT transporter [Gammaproteobacteria bacterium]MDA8602061.1 NupC/NupG family nucleoside CNT transporter [Gammaproteobacteria bacterium]MDA8795479.1 NupC/NupG family nucleoside CNT transporter [Gammaproteobacteria bacterium]